MSTGTGPNTSVGGMNLRNDIASDAYKPKEETLVIDLSLISSVINGQVM